MTRALTCRPGKSVQSFPPGFGSVPQFLHARVRCYKITVKSKSEINCCLAEKCCLAMLSHYWHLTKKGERTQWAHHRQSDSDRVFSTLIRSLAPGLCKKSWWEEVLSKIQFPFLHVTEQLQGWLCTGKQGWSVFRPSFTCCWDPQGC